MQNSKFSSFILGCFIFLGLAVLGYLLGKAAVEVKEYERTVRVKGLSEREYPANVVIWPLSFVAAGNDLSKLYSDLGNDEVKVRAFLKKLGITDEELTIAPPAVNDKLAQGYGNSRNFDFRYNASQEVTVYSEDIEKVRKVMAEIDNLGKQGVVFNSDQYRYQTEYLFTRLNEIKPEMIEEATRKAREVAEKFASDSNSSLGKIKKATQGQFSISPRDKNNPHIKKVRVVSTIEYYLSD